MKLLRLESTYVEGAIIASKINMIGEVIVPQ